MSDITACIAGFLTGLFFLLLLCVLALALAKQNLAEIHTAVGGWIELKTGKILLRHFDETVLVHVGKGGSRRRRMNLLRRLLASGLFVLFLAFLLAFLLVFVLALFFVFLGFGFFLSRLFRRFLSGFFGGLFVLFV